MATAENKTTLAGHVKEIGKVRTVVKKLVSAMQQPLKQIQKLTDEEHSRKRKGDSAGGTTAGSDTMKAMMSEERKSGAHSAKCVSPEEPLFTFPWTLPLTTQHEPAESLMEPLLLKKPEWSEAWKTSAARSELASFSAEFLASENYQNHGGRAMKSVDMPALGRSLFDMIVNTNENKNVVQLSAEEIGSLDPDANLTISKLTKLSNFFAEDKVQLWAMAPNRSYSGVDFGGFPTAKIQVKGFRRVIGFHSENISTCLKAAKAKTHNSDGAPITVPDQLLGLDASQVEALHKERL